MKVIKHRKGWDRKEFLFLLAVALLAVISPFFLPEIKDIPTYPAYFDLD